MIAKFLVRVVFYVLALRAAIAAGDIHYRLSGGASNADPTASRGGAMSTTTDAGATLFEDIDGPTAAAGHTDYRAVYIQNAHGSLTYQAVKVWVSTDTPSATTDADIALATEAVNTAIVQTISPDTSAPSGVTFANTAIDYATGLSIGDIPNGQFKGVWVKRVINAGTTAVADSFTITCQGDTNP